MEELETADESVQGEREQRAAEQILDLLQKRGFDKAQVILASQHKHELEAEFGRPSLFRTNHDHELHLTGIVGDRKANLTLNQLGEDALREAADELWQFAEGAQADPANAIAEYQPPETFQFGSRKPDPKVMYERLDGLLTYTRGQYPALSLRQALVDFQRRGAIILNSEGVHFQVDRGVYGAQAMFSARDGDQVSSFNSASFTREALDRPLQECGTLDSQMAQSTEQVHTRQVPAKFQGDLIITPDCLLSFLGFLLEQISDGPLVSGTSLYHGKVGHQVASELFTLESQPLELPGGYFVTGDGYKAHNSRVLDRGVLEHYLLGLYGAHKTGLPRADTGGCWVMPAGDTPKASMIRDVQQGVLISRFSGGRPNNKGDFSGIAKNSYYIKNGEIQYPLSETMISGNLADLMKNVVAVSTERADYGSRILPWLRVTDIGVS